MAAMLCLLLAICLSGCQSLSFYRQAVAGEYQIIHGEKPITELMNDPKTPDKLKIKFAQILKIRQFAATELKLPVDGPYLKYTDLHRDHVVWNVNVAPPLSLEPKTWWFPIVGRASYRGYFSEEAAQRYAAKWGKKGWDVYVDGVDAYSTLGWFRDPLLNTFIDEPEADLAELIFHELGHRRLYINGDTDFNEAFATEVAAEGLRRWFRANPDAYKRHEAGLEREHQFIRLVMDARSELDEVYTNANLPDATKLKRKEEIIASLRLHYAEVKKEWNGDNGYDYWFREPINNAKLNTVSAYYELTPAFEALLIANGRDMEKFYEAVAALGKMPIEQRHAALLAYLHPPATANKSH